MGKRLDDLYYDTFYAKVITVHYIMGADDPQFGKSFEAAFIPFLKNSKPNLGLYYIYNTGKLFFRYMDADKQVTRAVKSFMECDLLIKLRDVLNQMQEAKQTFDYYVPGKLPVAPPKKVIREVVAKKTPAFIFDNPKPVENRFLTLGGNRNRIHEQIQFQHRSKKGGSMFGGSL